MTTAVVRPAHPPTTRSAVHAAPWTPIVAAAALLAVARIAAAGTATFDRVWAEDGAVFYTDTADGAAAFGRTYAGYLHTIPRAVASLAVHVAPPTAFGATVLALAVLVTAGCAAAIYTSLAARTGPVPGATVALLLVGVPAAGVESLGNAANLQFFMLTALCVAVTRPAAAGSAARWAAAGAGFLVAASCPLAAVAVPVAVISCGRRGGLRHPLVRGIAAGLVVQAAAVTWGAASGFVNPQRPTGGWQASRLLGVLEQRGLPIAPVAAGAVVGLAAVVAATWVVTRSCEHRRMVWALLVAALLLAVVPVALAGRPGARYELAPTVLVAAAVALWAVRRRRAVLWAVVGVAVVAAAVGFPAGQSRVAGPSWSQQIAAHDRACAAGQRPAAVGWSPPSWAATELPCPTPPG